MPLVGLPRHDRAAMTYVELSCLDYEPRSLSHPFYSGILVFLAHPNMVNGDCEVENRG